MDTLNGMWWIQNTHRAYYNLQSNKANEIFFVFFSSPFLLNIIKMKRNDRYKEKNKKIALSPSEHNFGHRLLHWFRHFIPCYSFLFHHLILNFIEHFSICLSYHYRCGYCGYKVWFNFGLNAVLLLPFVSYFSFIHTDTGFGLDVRTIQCIIISFNLFFQFEKCGERKRGREREGQTNNNKYNRSISMWSKRNQFRTKETTEHYRFRINKGTDAVMRESENEMKIGKEGDQF